MSIAALQEYTRIAKYARYNSEAKRRETWLEQVDRVMGMHKEKYADIFEDIREDWEYARDMMLKKRILGSQRALQFGGPAILEKNPRMFNCAYSYIDRVDFYKGFMYLALCGVGVGFSVQKEHVTRLPNIHKRSKKEVEYVIPDSIEGWADATGILMESYFDMDSSYSGHPIKFDYSSIRPEGALITSSGAKAPGPEGLRRSLDKIEELLNHCVIKGQDSLRPIDAYDVVMHAADAVVSGGVRRSASVCLFSPDDEEMVLAKTNGWMTENPQRGRSNNSALLIRGENTKEEFLKLFESVKHYGEPGFIFADDKDQGFNPCVEVSLYAKHEKTGESGFQTCNLSEVNMKKVKSKEDFLDSCKAAAILGTLQAGYTDFSYLGKTTEEIIEREALLGVSMTGMMDSPDIAFDPEIQREGARTIKAVNKRLAKVLGINVAARTTCVKPSGSASAILGSSSGIHPHHAKRYIRRVQANELEPPIKFFEPFNPLAVETSVWDPNHKTKVISFVCEVPAGAKTKNQINALDLLERVRLTQMNWVEEGTRKSACVKPYLRHNISNTISIKPEEWDEVAEHIYKHRKHYAGISLLPVTGDKDYPQAPFTAIYTPNEMVRQYGEGSMMASGLIVHAMRAFDKDLWAACSCALEKGEVITVHHLKRKIDKDFDKLNVAGIEYWKKQGLSPRTPASLLGAWLKSSVPNHAEKIKWVGRLKKFARNYFEGDELKTTYLLKDVSNWKLWVDLNREYLDVPWEEFNEDEDNTKVSETVACGGGACELTLDI